ncbi:MAG: signal peptidase II [Ruminococcus flavefaciens]|jgi:signal peptidase II|nr:signal peptidase II [Ruminococcus flavefaciens]
MPILLVAAIVLLIISDQAVKYWAVHYLKEKESIRFIHFGDFKILDLTYLENDGAMFGSMSGQRWFLIGFTSLVIAAGLVIMFITMKRSKLLTAIILLFLSGGIGNLIDRIRQGYVVDMFEVKLFNFAIFNVADIYVTVAVALLMIYVIFVEPKESRRKKQEASAAVKEAEGNE